MHVGDGAMDLRVRDWVKLLIMFKLILIVLL